jgi:2-hydroxychromene-2-carboxylate isomerase
VNTSLELWFDFSCPYAYLASCRAAELARTANVPFAWKPMLLGGVFRGIGAGDGPMATLSAAKAAHNLHDMHRWADVLGVPLRVPAAHPMRTVRALRVLLALPHSRWDASIRELYAAYWQRGDDVTRDDAIAAALARAGASEGDIAAALARADGDDVKLELRRRTDEAIALGVFGAPAWIVRRDGAPPRLIWGQDRIDWVEAALRGDDVPLPPRWPEIVATARTLDVYFDVSSPFAYLGLTQLSAIARAMSIVPRLVPILLGGLFREIAQADVPLFAMPPPKLRWYREEMDAWARRWGEPLDMPRKFPQRTIAAQRLCVLGARQGFDDGVRVAVALGRAMWAEQRDLEDDAVLAAVLAEQHLPAEWLARTREPEVKAALAANTTAARDAGVFGVPTWVVDGRHVFWGQDRLELVARALAGWTPP